MVKKVEQKTLKIINFNAFGAPFYAHNVLKTLFQTYVYKRFAILATELNSSHADIVNLQEVHTYRQLFFLRRKLTHFPFVYYKKYLHGPKGGVVIFSKVKFGKTFYVTFKKSGSYKDKSFIADLVRRGMLIGIPEELPIIVCNTHLTHNLDEDWTTKNRFMKFIVKQLETITKQLESLALEHERSIILTGDFNLDYGTDAYWSFVKKLQLVNVFDDITIKTFQKLYTFDYIFLYDKNKRLEVESKKLLFEEEVLLTNGKKVTLSDHIGLETSFRIRN